MELKTQTEQSIENLSYEKAVEVHSNIIVNRDQAALSIYEMAKGLKLMRDSKAYLQLEATSFDEYVESKVGIKTRQAYKYISVFEKLGSGVMQSNANLGIEKLALLTEVPVTERNEFIESNDINNVSTRELKELVEKNKQYEEQLVLFESERETIQHTTETLEEKLKQVETEKIEMERRLKELENKPVDVVVEEITDEKIEELKNQAKEDVLNEIGEEHKKEIEELKKREEEKVASIKQEVENKIEQVKKETEQKTSEELKKALEIAEKEKANLLKRTEEMSKEMKLSADGDIVEFQCYFENLQNDIIKLETVLNKIKENDNEKSNKLAGALVKYINGKAKDVVENN